MSKKGTGHFTFKLTNFCPKKPKTSLFWMKMCESLVHCLLEILPDLVCEISRNEQKILIKCHYAQDGFLSALNLSLIVKGALA